jgi:hypothetical protein
LHDAFVRVFVHVRELYITPEDYVPVVVLEVRPGDGNGVFGFIEDGEGTGSIESYSFDRF